MATLPLWKPGLLHASTGDGMDSPNIVLCMTDDQGWGDTGYNGHPILRTPNLNAMASEAVRFTRFYAGAPVCSPTRGSVLTGRHPYRYEIWGANSGHMKAQERTLAEVLRDHGYATGHFGKWHLGTLSKTDEGVHPSRRGSDEQVVHYSPPWENGFDTCFSVEAAVATWDPMVNPRFGMHYYAGPDRKVADTEWMRGDSSRVLLDRAIPFIREAVRTGKPFFAVVWFHSPHEPVRAGGRYLEMYRDIRQEDHPGRDLERQRHYYGCLTAMDDQMGRLRRELRELGVAQDTILCFNSDNGPEGNLRPGKADGMSGSTKGLRGRKRSLYEGGIRVPGLIEWPARFHQPRTTDVPACTHDYLPTLLNAAGMPLPENPVPRDGVDLLPIIEGRAETRPKPIGFEYRGTTALIGDRYKLIEPESPSRDAIRHPSGYSYYDLPATQEERGRLRNWTEGCELYDLLRDPHETNDIAEQHPNVVEGMAARLEEWRQSCAASAEGADY
jgi:arylsulfatase A-like enzyme